MTITVIPAQPDVYLLRVHRHTLEAHLEPIQAWTLEPGQRAEPAFIGWGRPEPVTGPFDGRRHTIVTGVDPTGWSPEFLALARRHATATVWRAVTTGGAIYETDLLIPTSRETFDAVLAGTGRWVVDSDRGEHLVADAERIVGVYRRALNDSVIIFDDITVTRIGRDRIGRSGSGGAAGAAEAAG